MRHLDRSIGALVERGHHFTDDWPDDCLPLVHGRRRPGLDACVGVPTG